MYFCKYTVIFHEIIDVNFMKIMKFIILKNIDFSNYYVLIRRCDMKAHLLNNFDMKDYHMLNKFVYKNNSMFVY